MHTTNDATLRLELKHDIALQSLTKAVDTLTTYDPLEDTGLRVRLFTLNYDLGMLIQPGDRISFQAET